MRLVDRHPWIGLEDFAEEGRFVWSSDQEVPSYTNWGKGQPDDQNRNQDCGWIPNHPTWWTPGFWDDSFCSDKFHLICKQSVICHSSHHLQSIMFCFTPFACHSTFILQKLFKSFKICRREIACVCLFFFSRFPRGDPAISVLRRSISPVDPPGRYDCLTQFDDSHALYQ